MAANDRYRRNREKTRADARDESTLVFENDERNCDVLDDMFDVLANRYRRYVLYYLADRSTADLDAVLDYIVAQEADRSDRSDREDAMRRLRIEFHHRHLPMLEDVDLIEYDERNGTLAYRGRWPVFERLLRTTRRSDPVVSE